MHFPTNYRRRHIGFGGLCIQQHRAKLSSGSNASKRRRRKPHLDCGNVWQAKQGFEDGDVIERDGIEIASTKEAGLYQLEHYGMSSISCAIPNGNYIAKLHFAETIEGITSS